MFCSLRVELKKALFHNIKEDLSPFIQICIKCTDCETVWGKFKLLKILNLTQQLMIWRKNRTAPDKDDHCRVSLFTETHKTNFNPDSIISLWKYTLIMNVMLITKQSKKNHSVPPVWIRVVSASRCLVHQAVYDRLMHLHSFSTNNVKLWMLYFSRCCNRMLWLTVK